MKAEEFKNLTVEELVKKRKDYKEELFNLRFQHSTGQLDNTARMKLIKRDIARVNTVMRAKELENKR